MVAGGQTGVDQAALQVARQLGLETGGATFSASSTDAADAEHVPVHSAAQDMRFSVSSLEKIHDESFALASRRMVPRGQLR